MGFNVGRSRYRNHTNDLVLQACRGVSWESTEYEPANHLAKPVLYIIPAPSLLHKHKHLIKWCVWKTGCASPTVGFSVWHPEDPLLAPCPFLLFLHGLLSSRSHHGVFEAWFLLVQCVHWVQLTAQLLVTSEPQDCGPLLWLLTFYYHPTNRGHHRALQLVRWTF